MFTQSSEVSSSLSRSWASLFQEHLSHTRPWNCQGQQAMAVKLRDNNSRCAFPCIHTPSFPFSPRALSQLISQACPWVRASVVSLFSRMPCTFSPSSMTAFTRRSYVLSTFPCSTHAPFTSALLHSGQLILYFQSPQYNLNPHSSQAFSSFVLSNPCS